MIGFFLRFFRLTSKPKAFLENQGLTSASYLENSLQNISSLPTTNVEHIFQNFTRQCFVFAKAKNVEEIYQHFQINILLSWSKTSSLIPVGLVCIMISVFFHVPGARRPFNSAIGTVFDLSFFAPGWTFSPEKIQVLSAKHECSTEIVLNSLVYYRGNVQTISAKTGQFCLQLAFLNQAIILVFPFFCLSYDLFILGLNSISPNLAGSCQKNRDFRVLCGLFYTRAFFSVSGAIVKWFIVSLNRVVYK